MNDDQAVGALAALAHPVRLQVFRQLVRRGPDGVAAGELASAQGFSPSAMSFHLSQLERAGLVKARRHERFVYYSPEFKTASSLIDYLTNDCCEGRPEVCGYRTNSPGHPLSECQPTDGLGNTTTDPTSS